MYRGREYNVQRQRVQCIDDQKVAFFFKHDESFKLWSSLIIDPVEQNRFGHIKKDHERSGPLPSQFRYFCYCV